MAERAVAAVDARMHVIPSMAGSAAFLLADFAREEPVELVRLARMAQGALDLRMGLAEGESGLVVLELHGMPAGAAMTFATFRAHRATMDVSRLMATDAFRGRLVPGILVAGDAQCLGMFALERKVRPGVVESGSVPVDFRVAGSTVSR